MRARASARASGSVCELEFFYWNMRFCLQTPGKDCSGPFYQARAAKSLNWRCQSCVFCNLCPAKMSQNNPHLVFENRTWTEPPSPPFCSEVQYAALNLLQHDILNVFQQPLLNLFQRHERPRFQGHSAEASSRSHCHRRRPCRPHP